MWGLYSNGELMDKQSLAFYIITCSLPRFSNTEIMVRNMADFLSDAVAPTSIPFSAFLDGLGLQKILLRGHPWEADEAMNRCVGHVLSHCKSWKDLFSTPYETLKGVDCWFFSHSYYYVYYMFLVPWMSSSDNGMFASGFEFLKSLCVFKNKEYDYTPFDLVNFDIKEIPS